MIRFDLFPGGKKYAATFSYDDGAKSDRRLVGLFNKYGMKATFNLISSHIERETKDGIKPEEVKELYAGHEIAVHSYTHPHLERMNVIDQCDEIMHDRRLLEQWSGNIVRGMALPFGTYNEDTFAAMYSSGIVYARTATAKNNFVMPSDFRAWDPTTHHNECAPHVKQFIYNVEKAPWRAGGLLYIWGHSYEFDNPSFPVQWEQFEEILKQLHEYEQGIWFCTNIEYYDYTSALRRLVRSADGSRYYNPTDTDIWASNGDTPILLAAGKVTVIQ